MSWMAGEGMRRCDHTGLPVQVKKAHITTIRNWLNKDRQKIPTEIRNALKSLIPELGSGSYVEYTED